MIFNMPPFNVLGAMLKNIDLEFDITSIYPPLLFNNSGSSASKWPLSIKWK